METNSFLVVKYIIQSAKQCEQQTNKQKKNRKMENLKHVAGGSVPMACTYEPNIYSRDG